MGCQCPGWGKCCAPLVDRATVSLFVSQHLTKGVHPCKLSPTCELGREVQSQECLCVILPSCPCSEVLWAMHIALAVLPHLPFPPFLLGGQHHRPPSSFLLAGLGVRHAWASLCWPQGEGGATANPIPKVWPGHSLLPHDFSLNE